MLGLLPYFWRLIPGNPILQRVVATASKRKRDLFTRCGYLGLLIAIVLYALVQSAGDRTGGLAALAKTSASLFQELSYLQLALVSLLAPVFTAGAITQERDSQTYDVLLTTPLTNGQIVLGTLLSRVFFVVALLVSGIPIFSITQIFGGVAIGAIGMSFLIAAATALVTGALAIAIATLKVGTRRTIFSFYLFIAVYLAGGYFADSLIQIHPTQTNGTPMSISWLTGLHPFLALRVIFTQPNYLPPDISQIPPGLRFWPLTWYFTSPAGFYVTFMFLLSTALVIPSIGLLRVLAQTTVSPAKWLATALRLSKGDRTRPPRTVWSNPIAWREAKTKGSAGRAVVLRYGFTCLGLFGSIILLVGYLREMPSSRYVSATSFDRSLNQLTVYENQRATILTIPENFHAQLRSPDGKSSTDFPLENIKTRFDVFEFIPLGAAARPTAGTLVLSEVPRRIPAETARQFLLAMIFVEAAAILLVVTNAAASTVTREKEDGTLDLLLTSPITSRYYIWGKLRGLVIFVLPLIAVPTLSVLVFVVGDAISQLFGSVSEWVIVPEAVLHLPIMLIVVATFAGITGMNMSLRMRTTVRAVMISIALVLGVCGLLGFCGNKLVANDGDSVVAIALSAFSPFTVLMVLIDPRQFGGSVYTQADQISSGRIALSVFSLIATSVYLAVVWAMYKAMVKNFDMTIRKQSR